MVRNPMNYHQVSKIPLTPDLVDCFVFWTKNPAEMIASLDLLKSYNYYFLFTITSYAGSIELNVPNKSGVIDTFKNLSDTIGNHRVIWRYDPILFSDKITEEYHYKYFEHIAKNLQGYTDKCVISFLDLYKKCQNNMKNIGLIPVDHNDILRVSQGLNEIARAHNIQLSTCAEEIDLLAFGITSNKCVDPDLIKKISSQEITVLKDKTQRESCGCVSSIDVGSYNTCSHNCLYCYANYNFGSVNSNLLKHNPESPLLIGELESSDKVTVRKMESYFNLQRKLL